MGVFSDTLGHDVTEKRSKIFTIFLTIIRNILVFPMTYYVYRHKHPMTKAIFYVGKGTGDRAYETCGRSNEWLNVRKEIVSSCGMDREVEIVHCFDDEEKALELESIEIYRAKLLGFELVNKVKLKNPIPKLEGREDENICKEASFIPKIVRLKRKALGLTQRDIAGCAGTGLRFIVDLEKGKPTCQINKVEQVLRILGLTLSAAEYKPLP